MALLEKSVANINYVEFRKFVSKQGFPGTRIPGPGRFVLELEPRGPELFFGKTFNMILCMITYSDIKSRHIFEGNQN